MKTYLVAVAVLLAVAGCAPGSQTTHAKPAPSTNTPATQTGVRIGVYDSRSVAVAYAGSAVFDEWNKALHAEYEKAKAAGDTVKVAELEAQGKTRQQEFHMQGFSTAPVDNLLKAIEDRIPGIKEAAGVETLVSKWDTAQLENYPNAEQVDVTMALVDAFEPNAKQRQSAIEVQEHKPIALEKAARIQD